MAYTKQELDAKKELILKACSHEETEYVPSNLFGGNGFLAYAGMNYFDVEHDEENFKKSLDVVFSKIHCDIAMLSYVGAPRAHEALGQKTETFLAADGITPQHLQIDKMKEDEYPQLIENPKALINNVLLPRKYPQLFNGDKKAAIQALKTVVEEQAELFATGPAAKRTKWMAEEYGVLFAWNMKEPRITNPGDVIFDRFRGFKGSILDMRRRPEQFRAALDAIWNTMCDDFSDAGELPAFPFFGHFPHIPAYMSPKQFYEFYWPYEKIMFENIAKYGGKVILSAEGAWLGFMDGFRDIPKSSVILFVDEDDILEMNRVIGDWQVLGGGAKLAQTKFASKEENIDYAKKVIDECAPGGGFIFSAEKRMICPGDVNQTLIDVYNFAYEYSRKG